MSDHTYFHPIFWTPSSTACRSNGGCSARMKLSKNMHWYRPTVSCQYYPHYFFIGATEVSEHPWWPIIDLSIYAHSGELVTVIVFLRYTVVPIELHVCM